MNLRKLFRVGTGCGIEVRGDDLLVVAAKSRPKGVSVLGRQVLARFRERPPHEWGTEYAEFVKDLGLSHLAATVSIPRNDVIVRQIQLPPVKGKDLAAAVHYQIDTLHPFGEDEVYHAYAPLRGIEKEGGDLPVGIVIAEKQKIDQYADLFETAGIPVSSFSVTAAAFFTGVRVRWDNPPVPFLITDFQDQQLEIYGEGNNRPLFSAAFDLSVLPPTRALHLAGSDLRLEGEESAVLAVCGESSGSSGGVEGIDSASADHLALEADGTFEQRSISEILPSPTAAPIDFEVRRDAAAMAVALEAACPRLGWRANLLPLERRKSGSRWIYAPSLVLGSLLILILLGHLLRGTIQDRAYVQALRTEQERLAESVSKAQSSRDSIADARRRIGRLQFLAKRTELDMGVLAELSELIPDTAWLKTLTLEDEGIVITGEAESAAPLLGRLNDARYLTEAAFSTSLREIEGGQSFRIAAIRQDPGVFYSDEPSRQSVLTVQTAGEPQESPDAPATLTTVGEQDGSADAEQEPREGAFEEVLR
ncbi:MAG: pilus assembly protein PilM [Bryobacterales bacterium]|nr:pilus assembly protein PilM [Bryobacterales bacterium]